MHESEGTERNKIRFLKVEGLKFGKYGVPLRRERHADLKPDHQGENVS